MNKLYNYLLCILVATSTLFAREEGDLREQTSIGRLRMLVSKNPQLLKVAAIMGISTLILFFCYKLQYKKPPAIPKPEVEKDIQKEPQIEEDSKKPHEDDPVPNATQNEWQMPFFLW
jgi:hypothetical protein